MLASTNKREPEIQIWPELRKIAKAAPLAASSKLGASAKTIFADLPPNSKYTRFRLERAEYSSKRRPVAPEPVNTSTSTSMDIASSSPISEPLPVTTFSTPAGTPASCANSARRNIVKDASSAGLTTMELPMAKAGAIFQAPIMSGIFQGIMAPTTPTACFCTMAKKPGSVGATSPYTLSKASA